MANNTVVLSKAESVATLALNRPDNFNALSIQLAQELYEALSDCEDDPSVRAVVLTGAGKAFCAGGDVKEFHQNLGDIGLYLRKLTGSLHKSIVKICSMDKPVIASVNGVAAGGGFSLSLACDLTIAGESAKFVPAYSEIAASPDLGMTYFLPRVLGHKRAFELAFAKKILSASEALEWGIANQVTKDADLSMVTSQVAAGLGGGSGLAIGSTKKLFQLSWSQTLESQMENETEYIAQAGSSEDFREGVSAFIERRKPVFKGR